MFAFWRIYVYTLYRNTPVLEPFLGIFFYVWQFSHYFLRWRIYVYALYRNTPVLEPFLGIFLLCVAI